MLTNFAWVDHGRPSSKGSSADLPSAVDTGPRPGGRARPFGVISFFSFFFLSSVGEKYCVTAESLILPSHAIRSSYSPSARATHVTRQHRPTRGVRQYDTLRTLDNANSTRSSTSALVPVLHSRLLTHGQHESG